MTKFLAKNNGSQLEFSNQRWYAYKKLEEIWADPKQSVKLIKIISGFAGQGSTHLSDDCMPVVEKLDELGLINTYEKNRYGTNIWNSGITTGIKVVDAEFLNFVFYKENNSSVLNMAKLKAIEYRNGHSLGEVDYVPHTECCNTM